MNKDKYKYKEKGERGSGVVKKTEMKMVDQKAKKNMKKQMKKLRIRNSV